MEIPKNIKKPILFSERIGLTDESVPSILQLDTHQ